MRRTVRTAFVLSSTIAMAVAPLAATANAAAPRTAVCQSTSYAPTHTSTAASGKGAFGC